MAEIILNKPAAGAQDIVNAQPDARLLLDFPAGDATLERSGDDLIFRFDDGSSLVLRDFYNAYSKENMPDFVIDGTPISGEEFFAALNNEDLMPAAGPSASNADGGRYREYADDPLQVGVDRLGGLDLSSDRAFYPERDPWGGLDDGSSSGPNREPILQISGSIGVIEAGVRPGGNDAYEGVPLMSGRVEATDDDGDLLAYGFIDAAGNRVTAIDAEHGSIVIAQDGTYTYTLDNNDPDTNRLALGETETETFTVFVDDGRGGFVTQQVTVTITGTNDAPELSVTGSGQGVVEDGAQSVTGTVTVADPDSDAGTDQTFHIDGANGGTGTDGSRTENGTTEATFTTDYGKLVLNPETGTWEYTLDNTSDAVQKLGEGESRTETFTVTVTDEHGATSQQTITVTITGTNDAPVISGTDDLTLKETGVQDGGNDATQPGGTVMPEGNEHKLIATGKVDASDIDSDDDASSLDYKLQDADGKPADAIETPYGKVSIDAEGNYTYELKDGEANRLAQGDTVTETITVVVTDSHGATVTKDVTVTIYGTNDQPTLELSKPTLEVVESGVGRDSEGNIIENGTPEQENAGYAGQISAGGTATGADADNGASLTYGLGVNGAPQYAENGAVTSAGKYGDLTINPDGSYTYTLNDGQLDGLNEGEKQSESFTVYVKDEHGAWTSQEVTVNITGTNDRPHLDIKNAEQSIKEDGDASTVGGDFTITDPDTDGVNQTITIKGDEHTTGNSTDGSRTENGTTEATFTTDYGKLVLNPETGTWEYTLDNTSDAVQKLGEGETRTETFTVTVTDEHGATSTETITVTITGTNDDPVVDGHTEALSLKEAGVGPDGGDPNAPVAGVSTASGTVEAHDVDANDPNLSYSLAAGEGTTIISSDTDPDTGVQSIVTQYGTLVLTPGSLTADGKPSYTYTLDQGLADTLNAGQTHNETFVLTVADGHGGTAEVPIHVTIEGTNDKPELKIDNATEGKLTEDGDISAVSGTFTVTDSDADGAFNGQTSGVGNQRYSIAGGTAADGDVTTGNGMPSPDGGGAATFTTPYGTLTVNPDGTWTYALNNDSDALNALKDGETRTETFDVTVTDVHGANHTQPITVTIKGTNDAPMLKPVTEHVKDTGVFGEDAAHANTPTTESGPGADGHIKDAEHRLDVTGQLQGFDAEGAKLTYGVKIGDIAANGTVTLTNPDNQAETTIKVTSVATDENGTTTIKTEAGTFTIKADGSYSFTLDATEGGFVDSMAQGEKWNMTFTATASDGGLTSEAADLTICIEGTNEAPTFTQLAHRDYTGQDQTIDADGTWVVEAAEQGRWRGNQGNSNRISDHSDVLTGSFGADDRDNGESANLTFGAEFEGGTTSGSNKGDLENLGGLKLESVEDLPVTDPIKIAEHPDKGSDNYTELAPGNYKVFHFDVGDFYLNVETGDYYFDVNDDSDLVNRMNLGDTHSLNFNITVTDEHGASSSHDFTINISGRNDRPELTVNDGISTTDGQTATGSLNDLVDVKDADFGDSHKFYFVANPTANGNNPGHYEGSKDHSPSNKLDNYNPVTTLEGKYGVLTVNNEDGTYTYKLYGPGEGHDDAYNAMKSLPEGKTLDDEVFHIAVQDKNGAFDIKELPITITGVNDKPVINAANDLTLKETGVQDGGNDFTSSTEGDVTPEGNEHKLTATGKVDATDVDAGDTLEYAFSKEAVDKHNAENPDEPWTLGEDGTLNTQYGTITIDAEGNYTYALKDGEANRLAQGDTVTETITVVVTDSYGATVTKDVTVTIYGTNDQPTLTLDAPVLEVVESGVGRDSEGNVVENGTPEQENAGYVGQISAGGTATGADADNGASLTYGLGDGKGNPQYAENGAVTSPGKYGDLTINPDGSYTYTLNDGELDGLNEGEKQSESFTVYVKDEHGAWTSQELTVNITGTNDKPELKIENATQRITEDATDSVGGDLTITDPDADGVNQTITITGGEHTTGISTDGTRTADGGTNATFTNGYGTLTLNPETGKWEYKLNHESDLVQQMQEGDIKTETFTVTVTDEHGATSTETITVTITGLNDKPVINAADDNLTLKETGVQDGGNTPTVEDEGGTLDGNEHKLIATGKVDASDIDSDDDASTLDYKLQDADGNPVDSIETGYGIVSIKPDGTYTYTLKDGAANHLAQGDTVTETITVVVTDSHDATVTKDITVTIQGTNDQPTLTLPKVDGEEQDAFTVTEAVNTGEYGGTFDKQAHELGKVTRKDADDGHTLEFGLAKGSHPEVTEGAAPESVIFKGQDSVTIGGEYGILTIGKDGNLSYKVDNKPGSKADKLDEGQQGTDEFTIYVKDEHGAWTAKPITITVNGVNDPPRMVEGGDVDVKESGVENGGNEATPGIPEDLSPGQLKVADDNYGNSTTDPGFTFSVSGVQGGGDTGVHLNEGDPGFRADFDCYKVDEGILYINKANGKFTFVLDNDAASINSLNAGEKLALKFDVKVTTDDGKSVDTWLTVNIEGTNDRPDLTLEDGGSADGWSIVADEAGNASISMTEGETAKGTVEVTDPDMGGKQGETFTFAVDKGEKGGDDQQNGDLDAALKNNGTVDGEYGMLTIDPKTGEYTYTAHENLAEGHTYTETFTVFVKDSAGAWDAQTVTVQVTGSADAPVIKGDLPRADVVEYTEAGVEFNKNTDKADSIHGPGTGKAADGSFILGTFEAQQTDSQADASGGKGELIAGFVVGDKFYAGELHTDYGTLKITIDGEGTATYSFLPPAEGSDQAKALDSLTEADRIKLFEDLGGLKVGVYDTAHAGLVQKDAGHDDGGDYFTINPANGQLIPTQNVDFYIHGTNDRPYFTDGEGNKLGDLTAGTGTLVENGDGVLKGQLAADDPDGNHNPGDLSFSIVLDGKLVQVAEGKYGILELREDGSYTYTITKPELLESLNPGQSLIDSALANESFDIRVTDPLKASTDGKLTIDMTGSADAPTITAGKLEVREDNGKNDAELPGSDVTCSGRLGLDGIVDAEDKGDVTWKDITEPTDDAYGTLTVNPDGTYTYTLTKNGETVIQQLNEGDTLTQTFRVQAVIEGGKTVEKDITVTIRGTNDRPVLDAEQARFEGEVTRDVFDDDTPTDMGPNKTGVVFKGELKGGATDVDDADSQLRYMLVDKDGKPVTELKTEFGTITLTHTLNEDGSISTSYTYTLDNESRALIDALEKNPEGLLDEVGIVAVDPHGAVSKDEGTITIKINPGKEDGTGPYHVVIDKSNPELNATVTEDGKEDNALTPVNEDSTVSGQIKAVWGENSEHPGTPAPNLVFGIHDGNGQQVQGSVNGEYGYLVINPATGEYVYTLYNGENGVSNPVQDLAAGETKEESFEIMLNGKPTGEKLTITIHGTNDAPVITNVTQSSDRLTEDATNGWAGKEVTGTVRGTDIDHFRKEDGTFDDTKTETVTYKFNTADNVEGSYDEDGNLVSQTLTIAGKGTVVLNTITGEYTFTVDPGLGHIVAGDSAKVNFQIVATDGKDDSKPADITINLDGVNHAPELKDGGLTINVTEDDAVTASGDLKSLVNDDRNGEGLTFTVDGKTVMQGEYGTLVINKDGTYTYTLNNASDKVQGLDEDNPGSETFEITVSDGQGGTVKLPVTISVNGKDDIPHVTVGEVIKATEGSETVYEGQVIAYDKDAADKEPGALTYTFDEKNLEGHPEWTLNADGSLTTEYGTYAIGADGKYTFTLDNESDAVRGLAAGTLTEQKVTVVVTDSQGNRVTQEVTVNISGQNTAPDFMDDDGNRLTPDAEGNLTLEASTADTPLAEAEGTGTTSSIEGNFGLADPDADGSVKGFTVNGTAITGQTVIHGKYGDLTINPDGSYTYTYTSDKLGAGETDSDSFEIVATDNHGATSSAQFVVNLEGTNDAPVITAAPDLNAKEAGDVVTGDVSFTDADANDTHTFAIKHGEDAEGTTATGNYGTLTIDENGKYTYEVTNHELGADESAMETFTVIVKDNHGGEDTRTVTVIVKGTNDAPVIEMATAPGADGDGSFIFSDADKTDAHSLSVLIDGKAHDVALDDEGTAGTCTVDGVGTFAFTFTSATEGQKDWSYTFEPDKALTDTLRPGQSGEIGFQIQVSDGLVSVPSGDLSVSFTGTNDAPVISAEAEGAAGTLAVMDGDLLSLAVLGKDGEEIARLDLTNEGPQAVDIDGHTVTFTRQADGNYSYELDGGSVHMGGKAEVSFSIQATDHLGSVTAENPVTLVADGTQNDAPTASGDAQGLSLPSMLIPQQPGGEVPTIDGQLTDSDPDGDSLTYAAGTLPGSYGELSLNEDGSYTYALDMSGDNLAHLVEQRGEALTETFTYTVSDAHGGASEGSITVTLSVPEDFSTVTSHGAARSLYQADNDDAAQTSGEDALHNTDGLGGHDAGNDADGSFHAQSALSAHGAGPLHGASLFTADDFGDQDIFGPGAYDGFAAMSRNETFYGDTESLAQAGQLLEAPGNSLDGVLVPSQGTADGQDGQDDLGLADLQPEPDLGGAAMPGLAPAESAADSADAAIVAGAPLPGAEDSLAHQQAMHEVNHSNG